MNQTNTFALLFFILLLIVGGVLMFDIGRKAPEPYLLIATFQECADAGYPIMESYPRRCNTPDGKSFTEIISEPLAPLTPPEQVTSTEENMASSTATSTASTTITQ